MMKHISEAHFVIPILPIHLKSFRKIYKYNIYVRVLYPHVK